MKRREAHLAPCLPARGGPAPRGRPCEPHRPPHPLLMPRLLRQRRLQLRQVLPQDPVRPGPPAPSSSSRHGPAQSPSLCHRRLPGRWQPPVPGSRVPRHRWHACRWHACPGSSRRPHRRLRRRCHGMWCARRAARRAWLPAPICHHLRAPPAPAAGCHPMGGTPERRWRPGGFFPRCSPSVEPRGPPLAVGFNRSGGAEAASEAAAPARARARGRRERRRGLPVARHARPARPRQSRKCRNHARVGTPAQPHITQGSEQTPSPTPGPRRASGVRGKAHGGGAPGWKLPPEAAREETVECESVECESVE